MRANGKVEIIGMKGAALGFSEALFSEEFEYGCRVQPKEVTWPTGLSYSASGKEWRTGS
jgi:hypothetical protein